MLLAKGGSFTPFLCTAPLELLAEFIFVMTYPFTTLLHCVARQRQIRLCRTMLVWTGNLPPWVMLPATTSLWATGICRDSTTPRKLEAAFHATSEAMTITAISGRSKKIAGGHQPVIRTKATIHVAPPVGAVHWTSPSWRTPSILFIRAALGQTMAALHIALSRSMSKAPPSNGAMVVRLLDASYSSRLATPNATGQNLLLPASGQLRSCEAFRYQLPQLLPCWLYLPWWKRCKERCCEG